MGDVVAAPASIVARLRPRPARADVAITATTQALANLIFARPDDGIGVTGEPGAVQRFQRLIPTMATVVQPA